MSAGWSILEVQSRGNLSLAVFALIQQDLCRPSNKNERVISVLGTRFKLPYPDQVLGLPTGQHITLKFVTPEGEEVLRPYTPVTDDDTPGYVDVVIKVQPSRGRGFQRSFVLRGA